MGQVTAVAVAVACRNTSVVRITVQKSFSELLGVSGSTELDIITKPLSNRQLCKIMYKQGRMEANNGRGERQGRKTIHQLAFINTHHECISGPLQSARAGAWWRGRSAQEALSESGTRDTGLTCCFAGYAGLLRALANG